jgi:hypothetical protein
MGQGATPLCAITVDKVLGPVPEGLEVSRRDRPGVHNCPDCLLADNSRFGADAPGAVIRILHTRAPIIMFRTLVYPRSGGNVAPLTTAHVMCSAA